MVNSNWIHSSMMEHQQQALAAPSPPQTQAVHVQPLRVHHVSVVRPSNPAQTPNPTTNNNGIYWRLPDKMATLLLRKDQNQTQTSSDDNPAWGEYKSKAHFAEMHFC